MEVITDIIKQQYTSEVVVVFDGDCPFCKNIMLMAQLQKAFNSVDLVDARTVPNLVAAANQNGFDLNQGMIVLSHDGRLLYGGEALQYIGVKAPSQGVLSSFVHAFFSRRLVSVRMYPIFRAARNLTLWVLGHKKL